MDISLILMGIFYFWAGLNHFRHPKFYKRITPPYLPNHDAINIISGAAEMLLAVLLFIPATRVWAAWGIILLLIAVFPANIYHLQSKGAGMKIPMWVLWVRLPLQFALIYWAYTFTY